MATHEASRLQPERKRRVRWSAWLLGGMVCVITKNPKSHNLLLVGVRVKLPALAPDNPAMGEPLLKLRQLRRRRSKELQVMEVAVWLLNGSREIGAASAKRILGLMYEAATMPQLSTEQGGDALQDDLPLGIADPRRETFLGEVCIKGCWVEDHGVRNAA